MNMKNENKNASGQLLDNCWADRSSQAVSICERAKSFDCNMPTRNSTTFVKVKKLQQIDTKRLRKINLLFLPGVRISPRTVSSFNAKVFLFKQKTKIVLLFLTRLEDEIGLLLPIEHVLHRVLV